MHRTRRFLAVALLAAMPVVGAACTHENGKTTVKVPDVKVDKNGGKTVQVPDPKVSDSNSTDTTSKP